MANADLRFDGTRMPVMCVHPPDRFTPPIMNAGTKRLSILALVVAAFVGGIVFVTAASSWGDTPDLLRSADAQEVSDDALATATELGQAFSSVAERVNPAVVQVQATQLIAPATQRLPNELLEMLPPDFDMDQLQQQDPRPRSGLGSGAFIREDGYIVTNNHVIENADELRVKLFDGRVLDADVVGADPFSDLAVLKVEGDDFPSLPFGDSRDVRVGQWVLAVGSPLSENLSNTVTSGIISSLGRFSGPQTTIQNYIQTDAAVNPGNSGGPLVNLRGEIVGINSAIATRTGTYNGISFAIPVDIVANTVEQLVETGGVERGYLGISFTGVSAAYSRDQGVPPGAAQISEIREDANGRQPAAAAGLERDDIITAVDGVQLREFNQLVSLISNKRPGDDVVMTYVRDGEEREAVVTLGRRPSDEQLAIERGETPRSSGEPSELAEPARLETLGLTLQNLSPQIADRYNLDDDTQGVLVTDVERQSEAFREADIAPGSLILEIDRKPVASVEDFESALAAIEEGETFLLRIRRGNSSFLTALTKAS
ncbi:MAG: Do family serine endopeptidase [Rubricoccaceae bacterium]